MARLGRLLLGILLLVLLLSLAPIAGASPLTQTTSWTGEYFNNMTVAGAPALVRADADINFFWPEYTSPAPGFVGSSNYSVRWTRTVNFGSTGNYVFTTVNDDGMRVWVDGNLTVDAWYDQGPTTHTGTIYLGAGLHNVRVEYYNNMLGGTARVSWGLQGSFADWTGEYYNNQTLSGAPTITRNDAAINFNWGTGSPDASIPIDHFSARWTRTAFFNAGTWRFTLTTDDGARLWLDGTLLIDRWFDQPATTYTADITLGAGNHTIRMEYYDNTVNAVAQMSYTPTTTSLSGIWRGQYFGNISFSGSPVLIRDDASLHFDWGIGSPDPSIPAEYFSVKWDSTQILPITGNYTVLVSSDDGVRVWVDGALVIDEWYDHPPRLFSAVRYYAAGAHNVHVEFYERTGGAMVGVDFLPGSTLPPSPPTGDVIVDDRGAGWQSGGSAATWREVSAGHGGHAFWTNNNAFTRSGYNWARWYPTLPRAGNYEVFAYIPAGVATTTNARYWIYHNNRYDLAARAQAFTSNNWLSLGTYYFSALGGENVSLSDVTFECYLCRMVAFDAVRFSPR